MVYVPNETWTADTPLTTAKLQNLETQWAEAYAEYEAHDHDSSYYTKTEMESTFWYAGNDGDGSESDADLIYHPDGNMEAADFAGLGAPADIIIRWYGNIEGLPSGWHLCDGQEGTTDVRGKIPISASEDYTVGATGGSTTFSPTGTLTIAGHILTIAEMGPHRHPFTDAYWTSDGAFLLNSGTRCQGATLRGGTTNSTGGDGAHGHEGSTVTPTGDNSLPPYIALYYLQKEAT